MWAVATATAGADAVDAGSEHVDASAVAAVAVPMVPACTEHAGSD